jgi:hypothetical protein
MVRDDPVRDRLSCLSHVLTCCGVHTLSRTRRSGLALFAFATGFAAASPAAGEVLARVPAAYGGGAVAVSGNGRFVATSDRDGACGAGSQLILYDRQTTRTECLSVTTTGAAANASSTDPALSADGQVVAFTSAATNLDPRCAGATAPQLYVRNRRTRLTTCVSVTAGGIPAGAPIEEVAISGIGNVVVFSTAAANLVAGDSNGLSDIYAVRLAMDNSAALGPPVRVSVGKVNEVTVDTDGASVNPSVSLDAERIAFVSGATNLVPGDTNGAADVFVATFSYLLPFTSFPTTTLMSTTPAGAPADGPSAHPAITPDRMFIVFESQARNLIDGVAMPAGVSRIYRKRLSDPFDVLLVSRGTDGAEPNGPSTRPRISADGRFVGFVSSASNLVASDRNGAPDLFATDLRRPGFPTERLSLAADGVTEAAGSPLGRFGMSADAAVVAFLSDAANLVPGDPNGSGVDAFIARIPAGPRRMMIAAGAGGPPHVRAVDRSAASDPLVDFFAWDHPFFPDFPGGVSVAAADVDGDGAAEVIVGAGPGGGPRVTVYAATEPRFGRFAPLEPLVDFFAYEYAFFGKPAEFNGGVFVAVGDVTGDGVPEIVTGAGPGGGPHVRIFRVSRPPFTSSVHINPLGDFFAYSPSFAGGVRVAVGDLDGDGVNELLTAAGPGGGPHVQAFKIDTAGRATPVASFFAYDPGFAGGVFVAAGDVDGDGRDEIITGADAGGWPHVRTFTVAPGFAAVSEQSGFLAYAAGFSGGVRVGAGDVDGDGRAEILTGAGPGGGPHVLAVSRAPDGTLRVVSSFLAFDPSFGGGTFVAGVPH